MQKDWMRYVSALFALAVLAAIAVLISMSAPRAGTLQPPPLGFPADAPAPKAADAVEAQKGFDALVSFTDSGFEPATIVVKAGQTIRFSNNASAPLQLMSTDSNLFVGTGDIAVHSYAEFTFTQRGQYRYSDVRSGITGTIVVQ